MEIGCHTFRDVKTNKLYKIEISEIVIPQPVVKEQVKEESYYQRNKEHFKEYYKKKKEELKQKYHAEKVNKPKTIRTTCECGSIYNEKDIERHNLTHRHRRYIESL